MRRNFEPCKTPTCQSRNDRRAGCFDHGNARVNQALKSTLANTNRAPSPMQASTLVLEGYRRDDDDEGDMWLLSIPFRADGRRYENTFIVSSIRGCL